MKNYPEILEELRSRMSDRSDLIATSTEYIKQVANFDQENTQLIKPAIERIEQNKSQVHDIITVHNFFVKVQQAFKAEGKAKSDDYHAIDLNCHGRSADYVIAYRHHKALLSPLAVNKALRAKLTEFESLHLNSEKNYIHAVHHFNTCFQNSLPHYKQTLDNISFMLAHQLGRDNIRYHRSISQLDQMMDEIVSLNNHINPLMTACSQLRQRMLSTFLVLEPSKICTEALAMHDNLISSIDNILMTSRNLSAQYEPLRFKLLNLQDYFSAQFNKQTLQSSALTEIIGEDWDLDDEAHMATYNEIYYDIAGDHTRDCLLNKFVSKRYTFEEAVDDIVEEYADSATLGFRY